MTNAEIAERLDGIDAGGFQLGKSATDNSLVWLIYEEVVKPVPPENVLAFCRAVVERVDGKVVARKIIKAIEDDFTDRRGLRQEWEQIDNNIKREIKRTWRKIIENIIYAKETK